MGRVTLAIDPGEDTGWSKWVDARLMTCGLVHPDKYPLLPYMVGLPIDDLVVELPQDYGSNRAVDPNNLISLGYKVGAIVGVFAGLHYLLEHVFTQKLVHPNEWKGQVPKPIHHDRHLSKLDAREKTVLQAVLKGVPKGKRHDVKDSVCLGLWRVGR